MCSIPELMPNRYRHIGICLSDGFVFLIVIIGPVVGRYAIDAGDSWKYIYYGEIILSIISIQTWLIITLNRRVYRSGYLPHRTGAVISSSQAS